MASLPRIAISLVILCLFAGATPAASQKAIDAAIERGVAYLKLQCRGGQALAGGPGGDYGIGTTALAAIALLEAKVPAGDPVMQSLATTIREAAYRETKTYQISLCLIFLDRLENPADIPLIQALVARLLAGQNQQGGWTYSCIPNVPADHEQNLRAIAKNSELVAGTGRTKSGSDRSGKPAGRMHPEIEKYLNILMAARTFEAALDDNSNTQFAVLGVWAGRKHGVPVDSALELIEKRFLNTQNGSGAWSYNGGGNDNAGGSPAMTCAGLIGLSVGIARREEQRMRAEKVKKDKEIAVNPTKKNDPFFNPPEKTETRKRPKYQPDARDIAVGRGMAVLGAILQQGAFARPGPGVINGDALYFLWSVERVGVIYSAEKLGGADWYAIGSDALLQQQGRDGSWSGSYGSAVGTSFAILFLTRANIVRDLSNKIKQDNKNELRAGSGPDAPAAPSATNVSRPTKTHTDTGPGALPIPKSDPAYRLASSLIEVPESGWSSALTRLRDAKGSDNTKALAVAIPQLDGNRKKAARNALAERLTRMTAKTLRAFMHGEDPELRRGAALAAAMKDDKAHVPDLIERLTDDEEAVARAAKAGLKSLTGKDFGPQPGATRAERQKAADAWKRWWAKQK